MKHRHLGSIIGLALMIAGSFGVPASFASQPPVLTLTANGSSVLLVVSNADPNAQVVLYYPSGSSNVTSSIGTTNTSGYFSESVTSGMYNISNYAPVYVSVDGLQSPNQAWPVITGTSGSGTVSSSGLSLSQTNISLSSGQSGTITVYGSTGNLTLPGNTSPSVANFSFSGTILNVNAVSTGSTALTICDSGSGDCATLNVNVGASPVVLSSSNVTLTQGQTQSVSIINTNNAVNSYYVISSNSNTSVVSASLEGNTVVLSGLGAGSSNITICAGANTSQCTTLYVNVTGGSVINSNAPLSLAQFSISSGNQTNSLIVAGNSLNISFSPNQYAVNPLLRVAGASVSLTGSGNGPYTGTYILTGSETQPIPIVVGFSNAAGASALDYFWVGNSAATPAPVSTATVSTSVSSPVGTTAICPAGMTCTLSAASAPVSTPASSPVSGYSFQNYLYIGMTPQGTSDPDVIALQERLTTDGFFSGPVTGYFGPLTQAAVEAYQAAHGLDQLGVVGPQTRSLLDQGI